MKFPKELLEKLSEVEHDQWMEWSKAVSKEVGKERQDRWAKLWVPYEDLSEEMKEADRKYARKVLQALIHHPEFKTLVGDWLKKEIADTLEKDKK